jgi:hypothetical protein
MNEELFGLLGINPESAKEKAFTRGLLGAIAQAAALSGPQARPVGNLQGAGQVLLSGIGGYESAIDKSITDALKGLQVRQAISEASQPKYMTIKTPGGGEQLIQIPKGTGAPTPVQITGLEIGSQIEFDAPTKAFIDLKFGKPFGQLTQDQKAEVLRFNNAPNDEKITSLKVEAGKFKFETGKDVELPRGRSEFLIAPPPVNIAPQVAPQVAPPSVAPTTTTPIPPSAKPTSAEVSDASKLRVPITLVSRTMTDKDVPLISDPRIPPKQQAVLIEARPQTQSSVEYVVNTNRAMQNLISEILASPGLKDAFGLGGETLSKIPGSPAADARAKLERLGGNLFIEAITALRNASKTGAGVGNATEKEGDKLERSRANLQQFQSADAARTELERLLKSLKETETNVLNAYERTYGKGSFSFSPLETPAANRPPLGNIFGAPQK